MVQCFGKGKVYFAIADFYAAKSRPVQQSEVKPNMENTLKDIFPDLPQYLYNIIIKGSKN